MTQSTDKSYLKGFIPFGIAVAVLSLCGGFTAAVPSNIGTEWNMAGAVTFISLAYSLGSAALAPIMGKLGDIIGRRTTLLIAMGLYGLGELLIAICPANALYILLLFRFVVGVGAAGVAPVVMSYIMTKFPKEKIGQGFSIYMFIACGMVIFGPTLGGIVMTYTSWRVVMWICVVMCAFALVMIALLVKNEEGTKASLTGFDIPGAILVLIFFSMALCVPSFAQNGGWTSKTTLICLVIAVISLIGLILVERKATSPILSGKFMARKQFILPVIVLFLSQGLLQSCMTNIITFCIYTTGDRTLSGIATSIMYVGMALGTIIIGPMADKKEPRIVAAVALVFVCIGSAMQLLITATSGLPIMAATLFLIGLGLGGNGTIFLKVVLSGCDPKLGASGSGTYNVFRDMSMPFGVALFVPMFSSACDTATLYSSEATAEALAAAIQSCESALHSTAMVQVACVVVGIIICLFLPKVHGAAKSAN